MKRVKIKCRYGFEYTTELSGNRGTIQRTVKMLETGCCWVCYNHLCEIPRNEKIENCGKVCELFTKKPYCEHNKPNTIMKLISYMVTCGGDTGFRFSNQPEWHSVGTMLLFDAEKWDIEKIYNVMKDLYRQYRNAGHGWTLSEKIDLGKSAVKPFINNNDGVYIDLDYRDEDGICWLGTLGVDQEKQIHSKEHDVTRWSRNGDTRNFDYDK